jgi:gliding motility-associated-like protein
MSVKQLLCIFFVVFTCMFTCVVTPVFSQVNITSSQTAYALVQKLTGGSNNIIVSNAVLNCPALSNGIFDVVSSNLGLDSGIILTNGRAATVGSSYGANAAQFIGINNNASFNNGAGGDPQLNALAGATTQNACMLEFDLVPKGDTIQFNYVFASEEYWKSTCASYNDAFAFFISGPGISGQQNIALVPGTNIPVTVNSINSGVPGVNSNGTLGLCNSMGMGSPFTSYYVDNSTGTTISYYGFTKVLTAKSKVTPCSTYHLKLTIADAGTGGGGTIYDSGVFIKAGSLTTTSFGLIPISGNTTAGIDTYVVKGCNAGKVRFTRSKKTAAPQLINYQLGGSAVNGVDYASLSGSITIPVNDSFVDLPILGLPTATKGAKQLKIYLLSPYSCNGTVIVDSATINIYDPPTLQVVTKDTTVCYGASFPIKISGNTDSLVYNWSPSTNLSSPFAKEPYVFATASTTYTVFAQWPGSGCASVSGQFTVHVNEPPKVDVSKDQHLCIGADLKLAATISPDSPSFKYEWTWPDGSQHNIKSFSINDIQQYMSGKYTLIVSIKNCAPIIKEVNVVIAPFASVKMADDISVCEGQEVILKSDVTPDNDSFTYQWTGPDTFSSNNIRPIIQRTLISNSGMYVLTISYPGCTPVSDSINVTFLPVPDPLSLPGGFKNNYCQFQQSEPIQIPGFDEIVWYTDTNANGIKGAFYPPVNEGLGIHRYYVSQLRGTCESPKVPVDLLIEKCCVDNVFVPTAFTPNNDGKNDRFHIPESIDYKITKTRIVDRWGLIVFSSGSNEAWDGTVNGIPVEIGTYFYFVNVECRNGLKTLYKGDITLIR